jgi:carboxymethylenebutenolidase
MARAEPPKTGKSRPAARAQVRTPAEKSSGNAKITKETPFLSATPDSKMKCYLARPADGQPAPGLILIHEWWGLNDWVKQQADRFAEQGYVALAVDLYHGEVAADSEHAHELMRGLADERALADLKFAFKFLSGHKYTKGKPTGAIGWCMGGGFALKLAIAEPRLACTVICYGRPVLEVNQLRQIKGPILGIWGANDRGIEVEPFKEALREAGVKSTHTVYPGAGHAFLNENNKRGYNSEQAAKAWKEIEAFLGKHLASE